MPDSPPATGTPLHRIVISLLLRSVHSAGIAASRLRVADRLGGAKAHIQMLSFNQWRHREILDDKRLGAKPRKIIRLPKLPRS